MSTIVMETVTQRKRRLEKKKQKRKAKLQKETEADSSARLVKRRKRAAEVPKNQRDAERTKAKERMSHARSIENAGARSSRLTNDARRHAQARANETVDQRISRLASNRLRLSELRAREVNQECEAGQRCQRNAYTQQVANEEDFHLIINTFCDKCCDICQKKCYPNQIVKYRLNLPKPYLPPEIIAKNNLLLCHRCNMHLKSSKSHAPSKAYWNNLDEDS